MVLKECPFCKDKDRVQWLTEEQILLYCPYLADIQRRYGFKKYLGAMRGQTRILWSFLGGDRCSGQELLKRGKQIQSFLMDYKSRVYQTMSVSQLMSRWVLNAFLIRPVLSKCHSPRWDLVNIYGSKLEYHILSSKYPYYKGCLI